MSAKRFLFITVVLFMLSGCGLSLMQRDSLTPLSEAVRLQSKRITVLSSNDVPWTGFHPVSIKGEHKGLLAGSARGALEGAMVVGSGGFVGFLLLPVIVPIGAVAGAAEGVKKAVPFETAQKINDLLKNAAINAHIQTTFTNRFIAVAAEDLKWPIERMESGKTERTGKRNDQSNNLVVKVEVSNFGLLGGEGADPETVFVAAANVKTIAPDGAGTATGSVTCLGARQTASAWIKDGDARIRQELEGAYECLSQKIVMTLFREHRLQKTAAETEDPPVGLRQLYPRPVANSLQPLLQWEAFPRALDFAEDKGGYLSRINDVTYDLKIYGRMDDGSVELQAEPLNTLVYQKEAMQATEVMAEVPVSQVSEDPFHQQEEQQDRRAPLKHAAPGQTAGTVRVAEHVVEWPLLAQETYFWTVRAQFKIDGQKRFTSWSSFHKLITPEFSLQDESSGDQEGSNAGRSASLAMFGSAVKNYTNQAQVRGKTFYSAVNLWHDASGKITTTNYHDGTLLTIGTKVVIQEVFDDFLSGHVIRFIKSNERSHSKTYTLKLTPHVAKETTIWDVFGQCFTEQDPWGAGGILSTLSPAEADNVVRGGVEAGMSKAAVLMAYGYPPSHRTHNLEANKWIYWVSGDRKKTVYFVDDFVKHVQTERPMHVQNKRKKTK